MIESWLHSIGFIALGFGFGLIYGGFECVRTWKNALERAAKIAMKKWVCNQCGRIARAKGIAKAIRALKNEI